MMINLIDRIKLLFCKEKELYSALYEILGFYPRRLEYYKVALTHKSRGFRSMQGHLFNNERLEFLGDAVLETVVSDIVFRKFERKDEGFLTTTRSKVVKRETLNRVAAELGLDRLVKKEKTDVTSHNYYMYGNAFEALMGAIYLDRGFDGCMWFFQHRILNVHINLEVLARSEMNFKSKLIELCQKNKIELEFILKDESSEKGNAPVFRTDVLMEKVCAGKGKGYSKKESQQHAAKEALQRIRRNAKFAHLIYAARDRRLHPATEDTPAEEQPVGNKQPETCKQSPGNRRRKGGEPSRPSAGKVDVPVRRAEKPARSAQRPDSTKEAAAEAERESIIRAAEEAAFREHAADSL